MLTSSLEVIGAKTESSEGSAATLGATDYILASEIEISPMVESVKRQGRSASFDPFASVVGKQMVKIVIKTEFKASGTSGTPYAPLGALMQACVNTETATGGVNVVYAPTSAAASGFSCGGKTCTILFNNDGMKYLATSCRGTFKTTWGAGEIVMIEFEMYGLYPTITDTAMPSTTLLSQLPLTFSAATISFDAVTSLVLSKLEFDAGVKIEPRLDAAQAGVVKGFGVSSKEPKASFTFEMEKIATYDFNLKMKNKSQVAVSITYGTLGNQIVLSLPKFQIDELKFDKGGPATLVDLSGAPARNSGDDHYTLTLGAAA